MRFHTRKWVKPEDLNANGTLFGGKLLAWIDEEAALYAIIQLENQRVVTKYMSEITLQVQLKQVILLKLECLLLFGKTSLELTCEVRNKMTRETIIQVEKIIMVNLGEDGKPLPHGKTEIEFVRDRLK